jgi:hypothetical protein
VISCSVIGDPPDDSAYEPAKDLRCTAKQHFAVEEFLVRSWVSIRRLLWLVAWAFWWLNLWGAVSFERLRAALMNHPWRLRKVVTYLFDWIATMLRELLHPRPKVPINTG